MEDLGSFSLKIRRRGLLLPKIPYPRYGCMQWRSLGWVATRKMTQGYLKTKLFSPKKKIHGMAGGVSFPLGHCMHVKALSTSCKLTSNICTFILVKIFLKSYSCVHCRCHDSKWSLIITKTWDGHTIQVWSLNSLNMLYSRDKKTSK
jgi:hypothetical protein